MKKSLNYDIKSPNHVLKSLPVKILTWHYDIKSKNLIISTFHLINMIYQSMV